MTIQTHNLPLPSLSAGTLGDSPRFAAGKIAQWVRECLQGEAGTMHWHTQGNRHFLEFSATLNQQCEIVLEEHAGAQFDCVDGIAPESGQVLLIRVGSSDDAVMFISNLAERLRITGIRSTGTLGFVFGRPLLPCTNGALYLVISGDWQEDRQTYIAEYITEDYRCAVLKIHELIRARHDSPEKWKFSDHQETGGIWTIQQPLSVGDPYFGVLCFADGEITKNF